MSLISIFQRLQRAYASNKEPPLKIATAEVMRCIKTVIKETTVASWINSVPHNYGDSAAGVLKANEWQNLATIYFPIALISLWGEGVSGRIENAVQFRHVLDHTMLAVSMISLACMCTMTKARSDVYLSCLTQYLQDLPVIHPHANFVPYYHMAFHLPHFFHLFGPVCSWWCFPFEHLIGQIQRILSNHKVGK